VYITSNSMYSNSPNCSFIQNSAKGSAGAVVVLGNSIYSNSGNCSFYSNSAA
jgi:hypothetical protein